MPSLINRTNIAIDVNIAKAIYLGIVHDTGVFQYSNVSPKTLKIAAKLIEYGFDFPKLIEETFYQKTYVQNQIMGRTILESVLFLDKRCIVGHLDHHLQIEILDDAHQALLNGKVGVVHFQHTLTLVSFYQKHLSLT